jgi:hypothetical protein
LHAEGRSAKPAASQTYVEERSDEPCRYGLTTPTRSRNPLVVEFEHWVTLARDMALAGSVWTAIRYVILPPGWRANGSALYRLIVDRRDEVGLSCVFFTRPFVPAVGRHNDACSSLHGFPCRHIPVVQAAIE